MAYAVLDQAALGEVVTDTFGFTIRVEAWPAPAISEVRINGAPVSPGQAVGVRPGESVTVTVVLDNSAGGPGTIFCYLLDLDRRDLVEGTWVWTADVAGGEPAGTLPNPEWTITVTRDLNIEVRAGYYTE